MLGLIHVNSVTTTYCENDARFLRKLGGYIDVHLKVCRVVAEVCDARERAIDGRNCCAEADQEGDSQVHLGGGSMWTNSTRWYEIRLLIILVPR